MHVYIYMCVYAYVCMCVRVRVRVRACVCVRLRLRVRVHVSVHMCMRLCVCICSHESDVFVTFLNVFKASLFHWLLDIYIPPLRLAGGHVHVCQSATDRPIYNTN